MKTLNTNWRIWVNIGIICLLIAGFFGLVWYLKNVFRHVFIALIIIYVLSPFAKKLQRHGFTRSQAFAFAFVAMLSVILAGVLFMGPQAVQEIETAKQTWPQIEERISQQLFRGVYEDGVLTAYYIPTIDVEIEAGKIQRIFFTLMTQLKESLTGLLPALVTSLIIVPILTIIFIKDREKIYRKFFGIVPNRYFEVVISMAHEINKAIENFISAKAVQSMIVAGVCIIGFTIAGVKVPLIMGILAGLFNIVPYIGPLLGAAPPLLISYVLVDSRTALYAGIVIIIAQLVDNLITQPVLLPKLVNEHPAIIILMTLIGAELFGALGLVLAIAVYSVLKIILVKSYEALDVIYSRQEKEMTVADRSVMEYG